MLTPPLARAAPRDALAAYLDVGDDFVAFIDEVHFAL
jgi:hypothetical protein